MNKIFAFVLITFISGCSSNVVKMGKDSYMISEKAVGCGFATGSGQEAVAYTKANKFCSNKGMEVETIESTSKDGEIMKSCANAVLKFRCVK
jgi:hypothetical protein